MPDPASDPARNWNPLDNFWRLVYPMFNPNPQSSPVRLQPPAPIWDLPSPHNQHNVGVMHPDERNAIPHFVSPDYFHKLATEPQYPVISQDPPAWMIVSNFGWPDFAVTMPGWTLFGPVFAVAVSRARKNGIPHAWTLVGTAMTGLGLGVTKSWIRSENRLQGYLSNSEDALHWRSRAEYERKVLSGEIDERTQGTPTEQMLKSVFGPKHFSLAALEEEYLKESEI